MDINNMPEMLDGVMEKMQNVAKNIKQDMPSAALVWKIKQFDGPDKIEEFLNDGKKVVSVNMMTFNGKILLAYAVEK